MEAPRPKDHRNVPVISVKWPVNTGLIIAPKLSPQDSLLQIL